MRDTQIRKTFVRVGIIDETVLDLREIDIGQVTYPPGGTLGPRLQLNLQLVVIHSGSMTVWIDDFPHQAGANSAFLLLPDHHERFAFATKSATTHSWLHARIAPLSPSSTRFLAQLPRPIPLSLSVSELMSQADRLQHSPLATRAQLLKSIGTHIFWQYIGEAEVERLKPVGGAGSRPVEEARRYIRDHLHEPLTLATIAQAAAISKSQLTRLFSAELNTTPIAFLWRERIGRGVNMLRNTGLSVGEIANRCGFQSRYHFSRSIRQATQMSPTELRQKWWQHDEAVTDFDSSPHSARHARGQK